MSYTVTYTEPALNDLIKIGKYLAAVLSEEIADRIHDRIVADIRGLEQFPERYPSYTVEPWFTRGFRKYIAAKHYTVFYIVNHKLTAVSISRVFFASSNYDAGLKSMENE